MGGDEEAGDVVPVFVVDGWTMIASMKEAGICTDI